MNVPYYTENSKFGKEKRRDELRLGVGEELHRSEFEHRHRPLDGVVGARETETNRLGRGRQCVPRLERDRDVVLTTTSDFARDGGVIHFVG